MEIQRLKENSPEAGCSKPSCQIYPRVLFIKETYYLITIFYKEKKKRLNQSPKGSMQKSTIIKEGSK